MKLEIVSSDRDHAILIGDEDHNDIAEFYHSDHATVGQSYETALALAKQLVAVVNGVAQAAPTREAIARIIAPQYFWQLDNTESGGRIYAAELETARSQADAILALYPVTSTDRGGK